MLTVGSLFSGIGGFDLGLERAGMRVIWQVENDAKCQGVLRHRWPDVEIHDDVRRIGAAGGGDDHFNLRNKVEREQGSGRRGKLFDGREGSDREITHNATLSPVDLICGGFPCQDLSVAGRRAGLDGDRSGLWFEFRRVVSELRPAWVLVENVPGLLSSNGGRDMATVLRGLEELGYRWAYRVLDSQYFGVAQRRRRVFIVGCSGEGSPAEVLFDAASLSGNPPTRREARADVAPGAPRGFAPHSHYRYSDDDRGATLQGRQSRQRGDMTLVAHTPRSEYDGSEDGTGRGTPPVAAPRVGRQSKGAFTDPVNDNVIAFNCQQDPISADGVAVGSSGGADRAVAFAQNQRGELRTMETSAQLTTGGGKPGQGYPAALDSHRPRRLTPRECERLQGFPDDWTLVDGMADGPRYRMLGNAVTVNVAEWIGRRIVEVANGL